MMKTFAIILLLFCVTTFTSEENEERNLIPNRLVENEENRIEGSMEILGEEIEEQFQQQHNENYFLSVDYANLDYNEGEPHRQQINEEEQPCQCENEIEQIVLDNESDVGRIEDIPEYENFEILYDQMNDEINPNQMYVEEDGQCTCCLTAANEIEHPIYTCVGHGLYCHTDFVEYYLIRGQRSCAYCRKEFEIKDIISFLVSTGNLEIVKHVEGVRRIPWAEEYFESYDYTDYLRDVNKEVYESLLLKKDNNGADFIKDLLEQYPILKERGEVFAPAAEINNFSKEFLWDLLLPYVDPNYGLNLGEAESYPFEYVTTTHIENTETPQERIRRVIGIWAREFVELARKNMNGHQRIPELIQDANSRANAVWKRQYEQIVQNRHLRRTDNAIRASIQNMKPKLERAKTDVENFGNKAGKEIIHSAEQVKKTFEVQVQPKLVKATKDVENFARNANQEVQRAAQNVGEKMRDGCKNQ